MKEEVEPVEKKTEKQPDNAKSSTASRVPRSEAKNVPPKRSRKGKYIALALLLIVLCFGAGAGGAWLVTRNINTGSNSLGGGIDGNSIITPGEKDIAGVAEKVAPSVVSIITQQERRSYFGSPQMQEGAGTGLIVSSDGYVLTNKHVVKDGGKVSVVTTDGTTYDDVKIVGEDPLNDLAFLKLNGASGLTPANLGDSSSVRIGQSVVAIGNALGQYKNTVTSGIISGTGRSVTASSEGSSADAEALSDLIQTDAAINPGNSGGPLVNIAGQVIGINTAVAAEANGVGFSIPINAAKGLLKGVLANGKVERAYVGVSYITITPEVAQAYKLPVKQGAYVHAENGSAVAAGSPADKAGIKDGDIITKVNDVEVSDKGSVASLIAEYAPGDKITLTILRDGNTQTVDVVLAAYSS